MLHASHFAKIQQLENYHEILMLKSQRAQSGETFLQENPLSGGEDYSAFVFTVCLTKVA